jgi:hypothetical protein
MFAVAVQIVHEEQVDLGAEHDVFAVTWNETTEAA